MSRDGNTLTIATADDLNLNSVNLQDASGQTLTTLDASGLNVSNADNSLTTNVGAGIINVGGNTHTIAIDGNTGEITGLSNTKYDPNNIQADRAATEGQIADLDQQLTNKGFNISAQGGAGDTVKLGETVDFSNTDGNIEISNSTDNGIQFQLANAISVQSVIAGDTASGNFSVIGSGGTTVTDAAGNVANYGANSSSFTDTAGNSSISSATGTTLTDAAGNTYITTAAGSELTNAAGDTFSTTASGSVLTNANGDITNLTAAGTEVTDALGNNASYGANGISIADAAGNLTTNVGAGIINVGGSTHTIAIDGETGEITGLSNTKYDPNNIQVDRAATEGQVADLDNKINNAGFNISAQGGAGDTVTLGETVDFSSSDSNLAVKAGADNQILFTLSSDLTLNSVSMQDAAGNVNYVDATGSRVADALGNNAFYGAIGRPVHR